MRPCDRPLEPAILGLQLLEAPGLVNPETAVLGPPVVIGLLRDPDSPGGLCNRTVGGYADLRLPQFVYDFQGRVFPIDHFLSAHFGWNPNIDPRPDLGGQVRREVERRIARLRWVADEESKKFSGIKGILNRMMGRRRLSGKEMYEKMVAEADWMVAAIRSGRSDADVISEVASYVGLGSGPPSLPGGGPPAVARM